MFNNTSSTSICSTSQLKNRLLFCRNQCSRSSTLSMRLWWALSRTTIAGKMLPKTCSNTAVQRLRSTFLENSMKSCLVCTRSSTRRLTHCSKGYSCRLSNSSRRTSFDFWVSRTGLFSRMRRRCRSHSKQPSEKSRKSHTTTTLLRWFNASVCPSPDWNRKSSTTTKANLS